MERTLKQQLPIRMEASNPVDSEFDATLILTAANALSAGVVLFAKSTTFSTTNLSSIDAVQPKRPISIEVRRSRSHAFDRSVGARLLDDGGIYKGRLNYRERVREIDETRDTKVDLPVDFRDVETVEVNSHSFFPRHSHLVFRRRIFTATQG